MNIKKITAVFCAALAAGSFMTINKPEISAPYFSICAESERTVHFTAVGQTTKVSLSNTDETPSWYSDNSAVATVDSEGVITAVGQGSCKVFAVFSSQILEFLVIADIPAEETDFSIGSAQLSNDKPSITLSTDKIDTSSAVWSSSDSSVATVDQKGNVTAVGSGSCIITFTVDGKNYHVNITSTYSPQQTSTTQPAVKEDVNLGTIKLSNSNPTAKFDLSSVPANVKIDWISTDENVASISSDGIITAVGKGKCQVIATIEGVKYITDVESEYDKTEASQQTSGANEVSLGKMEVSNSEKSKQIALTGVPEDKNIKWSSTDEKVAKVDQSGIVTAVGEGSCRIIAEIDNVKYFMELTSTYSEEKEPYLICEKTSVKKGENFKISAANTSEKPKWISTDSTVISVDEDGNASALKAGEAEIMAQVGGRVLKVKITVTEDEKSPVYGDADLDGEVSINDAVLIMSNVANPDKYPISAQGMNNADVNNRGDGVSNMDALAVQKLLAEVIAQLPE